VENKVLASVNGGKVFATIGGKVYLCQESDKTSLKGWTDFVLPNGNANIGTILVKSVKRNISPERLEFIARPKKTTKFDKFGVGVWNADYDGKIIARIFTPKTTKSGKANRPIAQAQAIASKSGKANKAVMAEILATQAHLAELIASIS